MIPVGQKKFKTLDAILSVICVVFVCEAAAPAAAIGNSQYFWWLLMIFAFLLPYGLISAELGTAYAGEGGVYDWVRMAFGRRWGTRTAWYYWVNLPLWIASLAVMFPAILNSAFGLNLGPLPSLAIELAFIWGVAVVSLFPVCDNLWILNGSAVIKVLLALTVGALGVYRALAVGLANPVSPASLLPSLAPGELSHISVILFNFLGFEIICAFSGEMEEPRREIPRAIIAGGLVIAGIYLFSAFGIEAAIPLERLSADSGLIDAIALMTGGNGAVVGVAAALFLASLFGNVASWSIGVNAVACRAAERGDMPRVFARRRRAGGMPLGPALMNGAVATAVVLLAQLIPNEALFWSFFALNMVMLLLAYLPVFPAFYRMRRVDPDRERPFRVPGGKGLLRLMTALPMALLMLSVFFTVVPTRFDPASLAETLPITVGSALCALIGEALARSPGKPGRRD